MNWAVKPTVVSRGVLSQTALAVELMPSVKVTEFAAGVTPTPVP